MSAASSPPNATAPGLGYAEPEERFDEAVQPDDNGSLLDRIVAAPRGVTERADRESGLAIALLARFTEAATDREAAVAWFGPGVLSWTLADFEMALARDIARIEALVARQVNAVLHQPAFQTLEASWRSVKRTVDPIPPPPEATLDGEPVVKVQLLDIAKEELARSFSRVTAIEQSLLYRRVYENGLVMAGAEPFGLLIGDYEFSHANADLRLLEKLAAIGEMSFAPFVAAASPELLGLERFAGLDRHRDLAVTFAQPEYARWRSFAASDKARFVGLVGPRVLGRTPYDDDGSTDFGFRFAEQTDGAIREGQFDLSGYLWANPAYALAEVAIRSFRQSGWFGDLRGRRDSGLGGGTVDSLPDAVFRSEAGTLARRPSTEIAIGRHWEESFARHGLTPLVDLQDAGGAVFPSTPSLHHPNGTSYSTESARRNAALSGSLQHVLCASRFAHYLQSIARNKIGSVSSKEELSSELNGRWLSQYVSDSDLSGAIAARMPLSEGRVVVETVPGESGLYRLLIYLKPQYQLDALDVSLRFSGTLPTGSDVR